MSQRSKQDSQLWDVIVIGAGFSGLSCATSLAESGKRVLVLEKRNILGGRACSYLDPKTRETVDNGQHLFMGCYEQTIRFLERIHTLHLLKFNSGFDTTMVGPDRSVSFLRTFPLPAPAHLLAGFLGYSALTWLERAMIARVAFAIQNSSRDLSKISCRQWLNELGQSKNTQERFWDLVILATLNISPERAPANLLATVMAKGFLASKKASRVGIASVGLSDLYAKPAKTFIEGMQGQVLENQTVQQISFSQDKVSVVVFGGQMFESKVLVCSVPPSALRLIHFDSQALQEQKKKVESLTPSPILSFHCWGEFPEINDTYVGFWGTQFHWAFQKSKVFQNDFKHWTLVASSSSQMLHLSRPQLIELAEKELRLFSALEGVKISRAKVVHEREATWVPPIGNCDGRLGTKTREPLFFFAGDWTDTGLPCTIESASLSGHRAADAVIEAVSN